MILNQRLIPEFDANGKVRSVLSVSRDISEHRRLAQEKEKLQGQLNQALKMESIGRLAGGVAHDFNNMLMVILGHSELALKQVLSSDPLAANLKEIRKAAQKSTDLTRQLLAFARKQTIAPRVLNLNETVASVLKMLGRLIREDIDLVWQPGANVWPVKMDPSQVDQILANLCVNARDAIAEVGKIIIETSTTTFDEAFCAKHPGSVPGDFVLLTVSDNGCGMDRAILDRLFEPYFTTKEMGKGTGLGLATVYGIVKQNNGFIEVDSTPGQGSTFRTYLPRHLEEAEPMPPKRPAAPTRHSWETLLVVEDEPGILKMSKMIFEGQGYTVLTAATPAEALRLAKKHRGSIHLLLTDVVMPEMNGRDLAKILMSQNPTLKCLFMSGYTADVIAHRGVLDEGIHFIQKPMPIKELVAKVREVLDLSGKIGMNLDG
jgi:signal transduction histidine kinase/CheY-like chemotaxis protein